MTKHVHVHFTKEEMQKIEIEAVLSSGWKKDCEQYYSDYKNIFAKELSAKTEKKIWQEFSQGHMFWNCTHPSGCGEYNFKIYENIYSKTGFTEKDVRELGLKLDIHHDYDIRFDSGIARLHKGTSGLSNRPPYFETKGHIIKNAKKLAKDVSFSIEKDNGEILTFKYKKR